MRILTEKQKEQRLQRQSEWNKEHPEEVKQWAKRHYQKNKEAILKYQREYYNKNKESRKAYMRDYYQKNKEKYREYYLNHKEYYREYLKNYKGRKRKKPEHKLCKDCMYFGTSDCPGWNRCPYRNGTNIKGGKDE